MNEGFVARGIYIGVTSTQGEKVSINTNNITLIRDKPNGESLIEFVGGGSFYAKESRLAIISLISNTINRG